MRASSRGNPNHDELGRFCSVDRIKTRSESTTEQYKARTDNRALEEQCAFSPARSIEAAEKFTRTLGIKPNFNGFTLNQCNEINKALKETLTEYPELAGKIKVVGSTESYTKQEQSKDIEKMQENYIQEGKSKRTARTLAEISVGMKERLMIDHSVCIPQRGEIYINQKSERVKIIDEITHSNTYEKGVFSSRVYHELGHMIAYYYTPDEGKEFSSGLPGFRTNLSRYADFDHKELMAEGWAEYKTSIRPRGITIAVGEYLKGLRK